MNSPRKSRARTVSFGEHFICIMKKTPKKTREPRYYKMGDRFLHTSLSPLGTVHRYILAQIASKQVTLVDIDTGNRWCDEPLTVTNTLKISKSAFWQHFQGRKSTFSQWSYDV